MGRMRPQEVEFSETIDRADETIRTLLVTADVVLQRIGSDTPIEDRWLT